jgi:hypothetical protein
MQAKKTMITVFFPQTRLLVLDALPPGQTFTQDYFMTKVPPILREENLRFLRNHSAGTFLLHMDNSRCHSDKKITIEIEHRRFARAPRSLYCPDLSPCQFWLFGAMKHSLKDREIQGFYALISGLENISDDLTFEDVQVVFLDWMDLPNILCFFYVFRYQHLYSY